MNKIRLLPRMLGAYLMCCSSAGGVALLQLKNLAEEIPIHTAAKCDDLQMVKLLYRMGAELAPQFDQLSQLTAQGDTLNPKP